MSEATGNPTTEDKPAATVAVKTEPEDEVVKKEEDSASAVKVEASDKAEAKPEAETEAATEAAETPAPAPAGTAAPEEKAAESKLLKDLDDEAPKTFPQVVSEDLEVCFGNSPI